MSIARRIVPILTLCGLLFAVWYSVLLARADVSFRENNLKSIGEAIRLVPGNAAYHALLAEHLEAAGRDPDAELEAATRLSPLESRYWIRRSFRAEVEQKYEESERYLIEAGRVDNGFDPRWALMNYYFRRGRLPEFWRETTAALEMSYGSLDPVFRLCLAASDDVSVVRKALPPRREILAAFFKYLIKNQRVDGASRIAQELAPNAQPGEVPALVDYCDRQADQGSAAQLQVWNALCRRHLLPFAELSPENGRIITNGEFTAEPLQRGFDWTYESSSAVSISPIDSEPGISIDLNGRQPDGFSLIRQRIPLSPGMQYAVIYEYKLIGNPRDSGLQWVVKGLGTGGPSTGELLATSPVLSAADWETGKLIVSAQSKRAGTLVLEYRRARGTVPWKGGIQIRRVGSAPAIAVSARPESAR